MDHTAILDLLSNFGGLVPHLGITFEFDGDEISCRMPVDRSHTSAPGIAHGGALMALMDTALGAVAIVHAASQGRATSTVEMKVNFLRPVHEGHVLVTKAKLLHAGRSLLVIDGEAHEATTGKLVAHAIGTFNLFNVDRIADKLAPPVEG